MFILDKRCSDICCDGFPVLQIDRKSKQVKSWVVSLCSLQGFIITAIYFSASVSSDSIGAIEMLYIIIIIIIIIIYD